MVDSATRGREAIARVAAEYSEAFEAAPAPTEVARRARDARLALGVLLKVIGERKERGREARESFAKAHGVWSQETVDAMLRDLAAHEGETAALERFVAEIR